MNGLTRLVVVAIMATTSMLALPDAASACTCRVSQTTLSAPEIREWFSSFDGVVFRGTVVAAPRIVQPPRPRAGAELPVLVAEYTFKVERVWKGVTTAEVVIRTPADGSMCGIDFAGSSFPLIVRDVAGAYLIAAGPLQQPATSTCSAANMPTRNEKDFLSALGEGNPPPK